MFPELSGALCYHSVVQPCSSSHRQLLTVPLGERSVTDYSLSSLVNTLNLTYIWKMYWMGELIVEEKNDVVGWLGLLRPT